tara:strand:+ start:133 stop:993 length:861 start_codon:yes stop_codon:yes gene_type:complete
MGAISKATAKALKDLIKNETDFQTPLTDVYKLLNDKFGKIEDKQLKKQAIDYFKRLKISRVSKAKKPGTSIALIKGEGPKRVGSGKSIAVVKGEGPKRVGSEKTKVPVRKEFTLAVPKGSKSKKVEDPKEKRGFTDKEKNKSNETTSTSKNKQRLKDLVKNKKIIIGGVGGAGALVVASSLFDMPTKVNKTKLKSKKVEAPKEKPKNNNTSNQTAAQKRKARLIADNKRAMALRKKEKLKDSANKKKKVQSNKRTKPPKKTSKYDKYEVYDPSFLGVRSRLKKKSK